MTEFSKFRVLQLVKPCMCILPEVSPPDRRIPFREKVLWTAISLFVFLVCCQIPLYGIATSKTSDPFYWMRVILASNRGTLMELGITPVITAGMVCQLMAGAKLIKVDQNNKEDKMLFSGAQKLLGLLITLGEASAYVLSGMYGPVSDVGVGNAMLIIMQLFVAGVIVMVLDEMLQKGYGLGSGINLFLATNVCGNIVWKALSPSTLVTPARTEFEGAFVSLLHGIVFRSDRFTALKQAFYRQHAPNLTSLFATFVIFFLVVYFQGFRVDLPVKHQKMRGQQGAYPIKLFYTSNTPIILQTALVSNLYFFSQLLYKQGKGYMLVNLIGQWQEVPETGLTMPVGGVAYYMSPPSSFLDIFYDPIRTIIHTSFVLVSCALFARVWINVSGSAPRDVAKQMRDQQMMMPGYRDSDLPAVLNRYIPIAAVTGGACLGALTIIADFLGAIGSGTGILLAVTIIYEYFETVCKEKAPGNAFFA